MSTPKRSTPSARFVALFRGINVGGRNLIAMDRLRGLFEQAGCAEVQTYIQSGNVVFNASPALAAKLADSVARNIAEQMKIQTTAVTRTAAELSAVVAANPFLKRGIDAKWLHVAFLADEPAKERIAALDPRRSPGDEMHAIGREVYLHLPGGAGNSRLTNAYLDKTLATVSTARNWNTVLTLAAMAAQLRIAGSA